MIHAKHGCSIKLSHWGMVVRSSVQFCSTSIYQSHYFGTVSGAPKGKRLQWAYRQKVHEKCVSLLRQTRGSMSVEDRLSFQAPCEGEAPLGARPCGYHSRARPTRSSWRENPTMFIFDLCALGHATTQQRWIDSQKVSFEIGFQGICPSHCR